MKATELSERQAAFSPAKNWLQKPQAIKALSSYPNRLKTSQLSDEKPGET